MEHDAGIPARGQDALRSRTFPSLASSLQVRIPIFIPCFDNPTYLQNTIRQLQALRCENIVVVDNGSSYPPMVELLSALSHEVTVVLGHENRGARHIFMVDKHYALLPELFCVTDPDLQFNPQLPEDFLASLVCLTEDYAVGKAGFSLDISDKSRLREDDFLIAGKKYKIWEWEEQFWKEPLGLLNGEDQIYRAHVDTTFAVYNKKFFRREHLYDGVRVAGKYTCQHLPWYKDTIVPEAEDTYYRRAARFGNYHKQSSEYASALLLEIYRRRPDLQLTYPEAKDGKYSGLIEWAMAVSSRQWEDADYETLKPYTKWFATLAEKQ